ncbi:MAG: response regulator [Leptospirales bacterium]
MSVLNKLNIRSKIIAGFAILLGSFIVFTIFGIYELNSMGEITTKLYNHPLNVSNASLRASMGVIKMHRGMKDAIIAKNDYEREIAIYTVQEEEHEVIENLNIVKDKILGNEGHLLEEETRELFLNWKPIRDEVMTLLIAGKKIEAASITKEKGAAYVRLVENKMLELTSYSRNKSNEFMNTAEKTKIRVITISIALVVFLIILMALIASIILKSILEPILSFKKTISNITETGKLSEADVPGNNEITEITKDFNKLIKWLEREIWDKDGQTMLSGAIRRESDHVAVSQSILNFLCDYLNYQVGILYLKDHNYDDTYRLMATYAYRTRNSNHSVIKNGEGLAGQAALEQKIIVFKDVPLENSSLKIESGFSDIKPHSIVVIPLIFQDNVIGIIELGSTHAIENYEYNFLKRVSEHISASLASTITNTEMAELLNLSKAQAKELSDSYENLKLQSEQLEKSEVVLKEKQKNLEEANSLLTKSSKTIQSKAFELQKSSKYKSEFLANMSHELRSPLNSIILLSQMLSENKTENLSEKQVKFAKTIYSSSTELLQLINDVLDLSKIEAGKFDLKLEPVILTDLLREIEDRFSAQFENKKIKFTTSLAKNSPDKIITDYKLLTQILNNFITNALKFTKKGLVSVTVGRPRKDEKNTKTINQNVIHPETSLAIRVTDTGIGIAPEKQDDVFGSFQQVDGTASREYEGTGLGLSIAKKLANLLNGNILLQSNPGEGSTFTLIIPEELGTTSELVVAEEADSSVDEISEPVNIKEKLLHKNKVLIIEDDESFSGIIEEIGETKNISVISATNGESGLKLAREIVPDFILLDIYLDGMTGWEVLEKLKNDKITKNIPVQILSVARVEDEEKLKDIFGYSEKPVSTAELDRIFDEIARQIQVAGITSVTQEDPEILIIDDDDEYVKLLKKEMKKRNFKFASVPNGTRGIDLARKSIPDLILLDIYLPDMNGWDIVRILKEDKKTRGIPIQVITVDRNRSLEKNLEIYDFHSKPIVDKEISQLFEKIEKMINSVDSKKTDKKIDESEMEQLHNKKILLVDDNMRSVYALLPYLEDNKMSVQVRTNGKTALEYLHGNPETDIVLMDIMMPEMDGYEAITKIRADKKLKEISVIAVTAKAMAGEKEKILKIGANDYIPKPIDINLLFKTMIKMVN